MTHHWFAMLELGIITSNPFEYHHRKSTLQRWQVMNRKKKIKKRTAYIYT